MRSIFGVLLATVLAGCGSNYVKVDMPLGKVVVYRNGVAYFEREARIVGKSLPLSVPRDKVDDFLKSLTVRDKASGKSLPVSFPSAQTERGNMIEMVIRLPVEDGTDVVLSYITESPAWKPSYRIVMADDGKVQLEGWAIVDNTSGEDWTDVVVGVGSSSALSFRYDLWSIRDVERQTLGGEQSFAVAPPTGTAPHGGQAGNKNASIHIKDGEYNTYNVEEASKGDKAKKSTTVVVKGRVPTIDAPARGRSFEAAIGSAAGSDDDEDDSFSGSTTSESVYVADRAGGGGRLSAKERKKLERQRREAQKKRARALAERRARELANDRRTTALANRLKRGKHKIVIEGWARVGDRDADANSLARANIVRNQLIDKGVPPAAVEAKGMGSKQGVPPGVRLVERAQGGDAASDPDADPVGESHFGSKSAISVQRGTSAMVSIVKQKTPGEVVYLYDAESDRGNQTFAFKAVRFSNPTKNTLEAGPVTVFGQSRFIGEGLTDPIPPESTALIPFALDRQIVVEKTRNRKDHIAKLVRLSRGVLTTEVDHTRETTVKLTNRMKRKVTVYVRHTVTDGWRLRRAPKVRERVGKAHLFAVELGPKATETVSITESTPMQKLLDLRAEESLDSVRLYLSSADRKPALASKIKPLMALHRDMQVSYEKISSLRERMDDYRVRMDELHNQVFTLKAVRSGGALMRHLKQKLKEISTRVQRATIELVNTQEKLMVSRVKFQDAIAELTIEQLTGSAMAAAPSVEK